MEGTKEVRKNWVDILISRYEAFKSLPGETITQVFERFNKLLNKLTIQEKSYPQIEINRKFILTLPHHVEHKAKSIRERDNFNAMSLENLYGKLKTYEMEQERRAIIYGSGTVDSKTTALQKTTTLVVTESLALETKIEGTSTGGEQILEDEIETEHQAADDSDYYTLDELELMEDKSIAYLAGIFKHIRFRRSPKYKIKSSRFLKGGSFSRSSLR